jgi:hypothetical protein
MIVYCSTNNRLACEVVFDKGIQLRLMHKKTFNFIFKFNYWVKSSNVVNISLDDAPQPIIDPLVLEYKYGGQAEYWTVNKFDLKERVKIMFDAYNSKLERHLKFQSQLKQQYENFHSKQI